MKRVLIIFCCLALSAVLLVCGYRFLFSPMVSIIPSESYLNNWYIENDFVYFDCHIVIQSRHRKNLSLQITAFSEEDFQHGLLTTAQLECTTPFIQVYADAEKSSFDLIFAAPLGEATTKINRRLPEKIILHSIRITP